MIYETKPIIDTKCLTCTGY